MFIMRCSVILFVISFDIGFCTIITHRKHVYDNHTLIKYYTKSNNELIIPIAVHLDKALVMKLPNDPTENKYVRREKFIKMTKNIFRDTERIFKRPNLNQPVRLVLKDIKVLRSKFSKVAIDENVSNYLKSYCDWQGDKKVMKGEWFYSIMLTGLDLYYIDGLNNNRRNSTGRGYMKGICSLRYSCTMVKWHPKNLAYILAHELAHSLGIPHDGMPNNECHGHKYIMNAKYNASNPPKEWSPCNKRALQQFLKSNKAWCLRPEIKNMIII